LAAPSKKISQDWLLEYRITPPLPIPKHCHGSPEYQDHIAKVVPQMLERAKAEEIQRQKQQGLGNPIISMEMQGHRLVAVKNRLLHSKGWKTFHDFLFDCMKMSLGSEWGTAEIKKPRVTVQPDLSGLR